MGYSAMKAKRNCWFLLLLATVASVLGNSGVQSADQKSPAAAEFKIRRGVNVSHWLSQSGRRGERREAFFREKDVEFIAGIGYDHIRLPVDEEQLWDEGGNKEAEAFRLLHNALGWCKAHDLRVILDLHILRSHHFNAKEKPLWTDPAEQDKFIALWRDLSAELQKYPTDFLAYELMNEAVADDPEDWNRLIARAIAEIRKTEPERKIVVGSNRWQSTSTFDKLRVPPNDRNLILSFHFYTPMLVTHYRASWTGVGKYTGPVHYPGQLVKPEDLEGLPEDVAKVGGNNNGVYNREVLEKNLEKPLRMARETRLPLYCGEWGCITQTPRDVRLRWCADVRAIFEKNGIAWANWDYKGGFGIASRGGQPDRELIRTLLGNQK